jgi:phage terminase small subunit
MDSIDNLSPRQRAFVDEYLIDCNGRQAAIRAGYSENSAEQQAHRLLTNAKVNAAIQANLAARSERTNINADWILRRLHDELQADMADLIDEQGQLKPVQEWPLVWRRGLVASFECQTDLQGNRSLKIRMANRQSQLLLAAKHTAVQALRERVQIEGEVDHAERIEAALRRAERAASSKRSSV